MSFARDTGFSPKSYLNRRLNQEACHYMSGTDLPIKEVARKFRFADEYYFSRFFYKMNGMRPGKYRQTFFHS
ncbi:MAG: helix-turn-helix domain-containing protein [Verrucomicrobia bacterium]|nr:helix-turn-helix domain-containing protein [Verrucomicrobiota bacterium]